MIAQVEDLLPQCRVGHVILAAGGLADRVRRPAEAILAAMLVDDAEPALIDKLIEPGGGGCGGLRIGIEATLDLRLPQQIREIDARPLTGERDGIRHAIACRTRSIHANAGKICH